VICKEKNESSSPSAGKHLAKLGEEQRRAQGIHHHAATTLLGPGLRARQEGQMMSKEGRQLLSPVKDAKLQLHHYS
jgi:hypothetical protein